MKEFGTIAISHGYIYYGRYFQTPSVGGTAIQSLPSRLESRMGFFIIFLISKRPTVFFTTASSSPVTIVPVAKSIPLISGYMALHGNRKKSQDGLFRVLTELIVEKCGKMTGRLLSMKSAKPPSSYTYKTSSQDNRADNSDTGAVLWRATEKYRSSPRFSRGVIAEQGER